MANSSIQSVGGHSPSETLTDLSREAVGGRLMVRTWVADNIGAADKVTFHETMQEARAEFARRLLQYH